MTNQIINKQFTARNIFVSENYIKGYLRYKTILCHKVALYM